MEKNLEIKKLSDIVTWADGLIRDGGYYEEKYRSDATTAYCNVKAYELWKIKTATLEAIERHTTYTNSLNKDIADKASKIELLEKEIEGRKEGYTALKELMDTKYISIEEHNKICKKVEDTIEKCKDYDTSLIDSLRINNDDLKKQVDYLKKELEECKEENSYLKKESKNKNYIIKKAYVRYVDEACKGREEIMNECYEKLTKDDTGYTGFKQYTLRALEAQEGDEKKAKEFLCDSAEIIFYNKRAEDKRKEETKKELNEAFGVPCGSDSIE